MRRTEVYLHYLVIIPYNTHILTLGTVLHTWHLVIEYMLIAT